MSRSRIRESGSRGGVSGFKRSYIQCPPVSAIQPNEVIIEPDTNTHQVSFTVVSSAEDLRPISVWKTTPLWKQYLLRMCGKVGKFVTPFSTSLASFLCGRNY